MRKFKGLYLPLGLVLLLGLPAWADGRQEPVDINLIIDGSRHLQETGGDAVAWICDYVLDGVCQEGDYLRIWIAGERAQPIYNEVFKGDREAVKALLRKALPGSGEQADFTGALQAAFQSPTSRLLAYTLLVSTPRGLSPALLGSAAPYLRYSRVMDFSGWRALVIAPDLSSQVREAASAYLQGR
jgi:hypothetical protein